MTFRFIIILKVYFTGNNNWAHTQLLGFLNVINASCDLSDAYGRTTDIVLLSTYRMNCWWQ